jgi:DNA-binding MarR family transcriptional regulator
MTRSSTAQRLKGSSLTLAQARALVYVSRNEGVRQVELAALLEVQPITLARLIDQLDGGGLVERRADRTDRRAYQLYLKPAARAQLAKIARVAAAVREQALRDMDERQAAALLASLQIVRGNLA